MESTYKLATKQKLRGWGCGKRIHQPPNDLPTQSAFARFIVNAGDSTAGRAAPLPDDIHAIVDAGVSSMAVPKPSHHEVICRAYIYKQPDHKIAEEMGKSRSTIRALREEGEVWVESRLYGQTGCISNHAVLLDRC